MNGIPGERWKRGLEPVGQRLPGPLQHREPAPGLQAAQEEGKQKGKRTSRYVLKAAYFFGFGP